MGMALTPAEWGCACRPKSTTRNAKVRDDAERTSRFEAHDIGRLDSMTMSRDGSLVERQMLNRFTLGFATLRDSSRTRLDEFRRELSRNSLVHSGETNVDGTVLSSRVASRTFWTYYLPSALEPASARRVTDTVVDNDSRVWITQYGGEAR
jgi:hypothetical protein